MDFRDAAMSFFGNEVEIESTYTGPYLVRSGKLDILVRTPRKFGDAVDYADRLMEGCAIMICFSDVDLDLRNRIFDYMNGVIYIINGKITKVSEDILMYTPQKVDVDKEKARKSGWLGR